MLVPSPVAVAEAFLAAVSLVVAAVEAIIAALSLLKAPVIPPILDVAIATTGAYMAVCAAMFVIVEPKVATPSFAVRKRSEYAAN